MYIKCICCKGPFHPSSGHYYSSYLDGKEINTPCCGACFKSFFKWMRGHTKMTHKVGGVKGKPGGIKVKFYEAAAKFKERDQ